MASQNIFAALAQPVRSVADYQADYDSQDLRKLQLVGAQRQNELAALTQRQQIEASQQNALERAARLQAAQAAGGDVDKYVTGLELSGHPGNIELAGKVRESRDKSAKNAAEIGKIGSENDTRTIELQNKAVAQWRDWIGQAATPEQAASLLEGMHSDARLKGTPVGSAPLEYSLQKLQSLPFEQWKQQFALGATKYVEMNKPTYQQQNLGGTMQTLALPGLGGAPTVAATAPITQSADNRATVGASMANAAALRDQAQATRDAANVQRDQATEMKLADDYRAQSKEFGQAKSAYEQLKSTLGSATSSPAATLAAATKFMKILDPGSVVRESELGMALAASGVIDRATNYISTIQSGKKLTPTQAADFKNVSEMMFKAAQTVQQSIDSNYTRTAKQYGLRPENVVQDLGQNAGTVPPEVAAALAKHGSK